MTWAEQIVWQALAASVPLGLALVWAARSQDCGAAARHSVLASGLLAAAAIPMLTAALSILPTPAPSSPPRSTAAAPAVLPNAPRLVVGDHRAPRRDSIPDAAAKVVVAAWGTIAGLSCLRLAVAFLAQRRLRRKAERDPRCSARHAACAARLGLQRIPFAGIAPVRAPMALGLWRCWVALPPEAADWSDARLDAVLLHELAHVQRRDTLVRALGSLVVALHWFHPLAHRALRALCREQERAADERAIAAGLDRVDYAQQLLDLAAPPGAEPLLAASIAGRIGEVEDRIRRVLGSRPSSARRAPTWAVMGSTLVLALAAPPDEPATASPASVAVHRPVGLSFDRHGRVIGGANSPGDIFLVYLTEHGTIVVQGDVRLQRDGAASLAPGGYLLLERGEGASFERVEVRMAADGSPVWCRTSDARARDPAGAEEWLAAHLPAVLAIAPPTLVGSATP